jgi:hypothetical protein
MNPHVSISNVLQWNTKTVPHPFPSGSIVDEILAQPDLSKGGFHSAFNVIFPQSGQAGNGDGSLIRVFLERGF